VRVYVSFLNILLKFYLAMILHIEYSNIKIFEKTMPTIL